MGTNCIAWAIAFGATWLAVSAVIAVCAFAILASVNRDET